MDDRRGRDDPAMILSGGKNVYTTTTRFNERASMNTGVSSGGLARLRRFAYWLDVIGLDPILGLIPGAGDAAGAVLAGWILVEAIRLGASRATVIRIAGNVAIDAAVGAVPLLGDIFDFAWKANLRNVALLERHLAAPDRAERADRWFVLLVIVGMLVLAVGLLVLGILLGRWVFRALGGA
jgi:hypothetical protein